MPILRRLVPTAPLMTLPTMITDMAMPRTPKATRNGMVGAAPWSAARLVSR
jgi:hypothetical protein